MRILATLLRPDSGSAQVAGVDALRQAARLRERIGLAGQYAAIDENLTGLENLTMVGRLYGASRAAAKGRGQELCWSRRPKRPTLSASSRSSRSRSFRRLSFPGSPCPRRSASSPTSTPSRFVVNELRWLWTGQPSPDHLWQAFAWVAFILVVFSPLAVARYRRAAGR